MRKTRTEKAFEYAVKNNINLLEPGVWRKIAQRYSLSPVEIPELESKILSHFKIKPEKVELPLSPKNKKSKDKIVCHKLPNGLLHNDNNPALCVIENGKTTREEYYVNGKLHRKNNPAIVWANKEYLDEFFVNGSPQNKETIKSLLESLEQEFLALDEPVDASSRDKYWFNMAEYNIILGEVRDACICWANASWERRNQEKVANKIYSLMDFSRINDILKEKEPSSEDVYIVAYWVISSFYSNRKNEIEDLFPVQNWIAEKQRLLDIRSVWLFRYAVASLMGGDTLMLATTRDALFERIRNGLASGTDLPRFIRFAGQNSFRAEKVHKEINDFYEFFFKTKREKKRTEPDDKLTNAYVNLIFAYAYARLNSIEKAEELKAKAEADLNLEDEIHYFIFNAYAERIEQAKNGEPADTPFSSNLSKHLASLESFERYKIDRLREVSLILEPQAKVSPISTYQEGGELEEITNLRSIESRETLATEIENLIKSFSSFDKEKKNKALESIIEFLALVPSHFCHLLELIEKELPKDENEYVIEVLQKIIFVAGYYNHKNIVSQKTKELKKRLKKAPQKYVIEFALELGKFLRLARRMGFETEILDLLQSVATILDADKSNEDFSKLTARAYVSGSLAYLGEPDKQKPVLKQMVSKLKMFKQTEKVVGSNYLLGLTGALCYSFGQFDDVDYAIKNLKNISTKYLENISDGFGTNSHFCKSVLHFVESVIMGYISESLIMGHAKQKWLDEDEYLVRRRINKDVS